MTPTQPQAALLSESEIVVCIAKAGCIGTVKMSYESGPYDIDRPSLNASRLYDAIEAAIIAKLQATQEPGRVFPPRIMELLEQVADRNPGTTNGPWEDAQGLPMQDDADAAISWIKARSVATQEPVRAGELPDEREAFEAEMRCVEEWGHRSLKKRTNGKYENWQVALMWDVWQARAALSARKPLTPLIARQLGEWHEDDGPVMWWAWNGHGWAGEPAWCGQPTDSDWPGYHTHWTPHPQQPATNGIGLEVKP